MKSILTFLAIPLLFSSYNSHPTGDSRKDIALYETTGGRCGVGFKMYKIKNNARSKMITATIIKTTDVGDKTSTQTLVYEGLAPGEEREVGCNGCSFVVDNVACYTYQLTSAVKVGRQAR